MRKQVILGGLAGAMALLGIGVVRAQAPSKPEDIIIGRQAAYDLMGGAAVAMKAAVDGGLDVKPYTVSARAMVAWGKAIPGMFPDGTQTGHDTKAKPEIWSDRAGFEKAAADFVAAAEKLATLADANDKAGFAAQFGVLGQACGACHRVYRAR